MKIPANVSHYISPIISALILFTVTITAQIRYEEKMLPRLLQTMSIQLGALPDHGIYAVGVADSIWANKDYTYDGLSLPYFLRFDSLRGTVHTYLLPDTGRIEGGWPPIPSDFRDHFNLKGVVSKESTIIFYQKQYAGNGDVVPDLFFKPSLKAVIISNTDGTSHFIFNRDNAMDHDLAGDSKGGVNIIYEYVDTVLHDKGQFSDYLYRRCELQYSYRNPSGQFTSYQVIDTSGYYPQLLIDNNDTLHLIYFTGQSSTGWNFTLKYAKGFAGHFNPSRVILENAPVSSGTYYGKPTPFPFSVSTDGKQAFIGLGAKAIIINGDSISHSYLSEESPVYDIFYTFNPNDRTIFAAWSIWPTLKYSSNLDTSLFLANKSFPLSTWYERLNLFLDPMTNLQPSFLYDDGSYNIHYLTNLDGETDSTTISIPSFQGFIDGVTIDSQKNVYSAYKDASDAVHIIRFYQEPTGVNDVISGEPDFFSLAQNYPNPFNPTTKIQYILKHRSQVKITIYNILGNKIAILSNSIQEAGTRSVTWDANDVASGVYFYRLEAVSLDDQKQSFVQVKKMVVIR